MQEEQCRAIIVFGLANGGVMFFSMHLLQIAHRRESFHQLTQKSSPSIGSVKKQQSIQSMYIVQKILNEIDSKKTTLPETKSSHLKHWGWFR